MYVVVEKKKCLIMCTLEQSGVHVLTNYSLHKLSFTYPPTHIHTCVVCVLMCLCVCSGREEEVSNNVYA